MKNPYLNDERILAEQELVTTVLENADDPIGAVEGVTKIPQEQLGIGVVSLLATIGHFAGEEFMTAVFATILDNAPQEMQDRLDKAAKEL